MIDYSQIEFPILVTAIIANIALAIIVLRYAEKGISRYLFPIFILFQIFWFGANFLSFKVSSQYFLLLVRLTIFFAAFHSFFFFLFIYTFLKKENKFGRKIEPLIVLLIIVAALTLTPAIFGNMTYDSFNNPAPEIGSGMPVFAAFITLCIGWAFLSLIKRYRSSSGIERLQWRYLSIGLSITFILIMVFSFLNFVVLKDRSSVQLGHLYTLPFIIFTAYGMIKHQLLHVKAIVAELAVIILNLILFIQLISSEALSQFLISGFVLVGTIILGILMVRSVRREVKQREQLQILTKKLEGANKQLKILDQARAEFISMASHQLRTPPSSIKWYLSALLADEFGKMASPLRDALVKVNITNNSMISLIDALLNVSRIERGKLEFVFEESDFVAITQLTVDQLQPLAQEKKLKLNFTKPAFLVPKIIMDKEKLRQVINNMIDNAIKYTKQGQVDVRIEVTKTDVILKVSDTGKGMSAKEQEVSFAKYGRGKDSIKYSAGLGLGMYLGRVIVEQHNGKIWAESAGEGKGSTFAFSIPIKNQIKPTSLIFDLTKTQDVK